MFIDPMTNSTFTPQSCVYGPPPVEKKCQALPQFGLEATGELARKRTDLYLIGMPGCGKSSLLAGVLKYMTEAKALRYEAPSGIKGDDGCQAYYKGLVEGLCDKKLPQPTKTETLVPMQFVIGPRYKKPITIVEHSGKALKALSDAFITGEEAWEKISVGRCLKNDNPKTLLFLFDYNILTGRDPRFSAIEQEQVLGNALDVFNSDGIGRYGEKNNTMSKVRNVAIVITKSDLMEEEEGCPLNYDERNDIAFQYMQNRCSGFMNNLSDLCGKYGINAESKDHAYEILVTTFSLGRFEGDNLVKPNTADAKRLAEFIVATTPQKHGLFGRL